MEQCDCGLQARERPGRLCGGSEEGLGPVTELGPAGKGHPEHQRPRKACNQVPRSWAATEPAGHTHWHQPGLVLAWCFPPQGRWDFLSGSRASFFSDHLLSFIPLTSYPPLNKDKACSDDGPEIMQLLVDPGDWVPLITAHLPRQEPKRAQLQKGLVADVGTIERSSLLNSQLDRKFRNLNLPFLKAEWRRAGASYGSSFSRLLPALSPGGLGW